MLATWAMLTLVGFAAGVMGALLGLGGGIFLVPALTILFDLPIQVAVGASLIGVIATSAGVAIVAKPGRGADTTLGLRLELASVLGAFAASMAAGLLSQEALSLVFAGIVLATAAFTYYKARKVRRPVTDAAVEALFRTDYRPTHWPAGLTLTGLAGALSGLTGTGGGFIKAPVMYSLMDVPLGVATATSNFMVGITAAASAMVYYARGDIRPLIAAPTALGVFAGAMAGVQLARRVPVDTLRRLLIGVLILVALQMAWKGVSGS
jgi:uncharacterized membrane protein YfcA